MLWYFLYLTLPPSCTAFPQALQCYTTCIVSCFSDVSGTNGPGTFARTMCEMLNFGHVISFQDTPVDGGGGRRGLERGGGKVNKQCKTAAEFTEKPSEQGDNQDTITAPHPHLYLREVRHQAGIKLGPYWLEVSVRYFQHCTIPAPHPPLPYYKGVGDGLTS